MAAPPHALLSRPSFSGTTTTGPPAAKNTPLATTLISCIEEEQALHMAVLTARGAAVQAGVLSAEIEALSEEYGLAGADGGKGGGKGGKGGSKGGGAPAKGGAKGGKAAKPGKMDPVAEAEALEESLEILRTEAQSSKEVAKRAKAALKAAQYRSFAVTASATMLTQAQQARGSWGESFEEMSKGLSEQHAQLVQERRTAKCVARTARKRADVAHRMEGIARRIDVVGYSQPMPWHSAWGYKAAFSLVPPAPVNVWAPPPARAPSINSSTGLLLPRSVARGASAADATAAATHPIGPDRIPIRRERPVDSRPWEHHPGLPLLKAALGERREQLAAQCKRWGLAPSDPIDAELLRRALAACSVPADPRAIDMLFAERHAEAAEPMASHSGHGTGRGLPLGVLVSGAPLAARPDTPLSRQSSSLSAIGSRHGPLCSGILGADGLRPATSAGVRTGARSRPATRGPTQRTFDPFRPQTSDVGRRPG